MPMAGVPLGQGHGRSRNGSFVSAEIGADHAQAGQVRIVRHEHSDSGSNIGSDQCSVLMIGRGGCPPRQATIGHSNTAWTDIKHNRIRRKSLGPPLR